MSNQITPDTNPMRAGSNVLAQTVMSTIQRGLARKGKAPTSDLDRVFDAVLARHPGFDPTVFQDMVSGFTDRAQPAPGAATQPVAGITLPKPGSVANEIQHFPGSDIQQSFSHSFDAARLNVSANPLIRDALLAAGFKPTDPTAQIISVTVVGDYEHGPILHIKGKGFDKTPNAKPFVFSQLVNNVWVDVGSLAPENYNTWNVTVRVPGHYGTLVPDTAPPAQFRVKPTRSAAANTLSKHQSEGAPVEFQVPHFVKADAPAVLESMVIDSLSTASILAGEQTMIVQVSNLGNVKVLTQGQHSNAPVFTSPVYHNAVSWPIIAMLTSQSFDDLKYAASVQIIKESAPDGHGGQLRITMPYGIYPGAYTLQLLRASEIVAPPGGGSVQWDSPVVNGMIGSDIVEVQVLPFHFTGALTSLEVQHVAGTGSGGDNNLNTFNVLSVVANGQVYTSQTDVQRVFLNDLKPWSFPADVSQTLKETDGSAVAIFSPVAAVLAAYNLTPGSDNQATLDKIKQGAHIAGELAVAIGAVVGGAAVGAGIKAFEGLFDDAVAFVVSFFHKTTAPKVSLTTVGSTSVSYHDLIEASSHAVMGRTGLRRFSIGTVNAYGGSFEFFTTFTWRRAEQ